METVSTATIRATLLELVNARAPKSICPSDVARRLSQEEDVWRALMPRVRQVAGALAEDGEIVATQRGTVVDAVAARGPIRLSRP